MADVMELSEADRSKRSAAQKALDFVQDGMKLGLGTGSTAKWFVDLLGAHLAERKWTVTCVPTSSRTRAQAAGLGIPLADLGDLGSLDVTVDGADEVDRAMNLIKGGGGALLQEKIVATASEQMVVIADPSKTVETLGAFPLPVEIVRFAHRSTLAAIAEVLEPADVAARDMALRMDGPDPYVTDEGHYIVDLHLKQIKDPDILGISLNQVPGVVETGLFCGIATTLIVGQADGTSAESTV